MSENLRSLVISRWMVSAFPSFTALYTFMADSHSHGMSSRTELAAIKMLTGSPGSPDMVHELFKHQRVEAAHPPTAERFAAASLLSAPRHVKASLHFFGLLGDGTLPNFFFRLGLRCARVAAKQTEQRNAGGLSATEEFLDLSPQQRNFRSRDVHDDLRVHNEISVNQDVTKPSDSLPLDIRHRRANLGRQSLHRLADDLQVSDHGIESLLIVLE
jgi:hypothetical protein